jgi:glucan phosphoethanolaminetransferase (alkaline phosphatase superfamily)
MPGRPATGGTGWRTALFCGIWVVLAPASLLFAGSGTVRTPDTASGWIGLAVLLVANGSLLALPVLLPAPRWLRRAILLPAALAAVFTLAYMLRYGGAPGPAVLGSIARSGLRELGDVLPALLANQLMAIAAFAALAFWIWRLPALPLLRRGARLALLNVAIWSCNALAAAWSFWPQGYARFVPAGAEYAVFPGNLLLGAWNAWRHAPEDAEEHARAAFRFGAQAGSEQAMRIVLVIGESASAARWQLGGYARPTNPLLATTEGLSYFPTASADATTTHDALPMILTRATPQDPRRGLREKSLSSPHSRRRAMRQPGFPIKIDTGPAWKPIPRSM